jgi:ATP-binding cassette subfamily B protein RaxB
VGELRLRHAEIDRHFTGFALELSPTPALEMRKLPPRPRLSQLLGPIPELRPALARILAVALLLEGLALVMPLMGQVVVDDVLAAGRVSLLSVVASAFIFLVVLQALLSFGRSRLVLKLGESIAFQWKHRLFSHLLRLPVRYFELRHLGSVVTRFGAIDDVRRTLTQAALESVLDGLLALAALVLMVRYSTALSAVVIGVVVLYAILRWALYWPLRRASEEGFALSGKEGTFFVETLRAMMPIKLFGREEFRLARWTSIAKDVQIRRLRVARLGVWASTGSMFLFGVENVLVFWVGGGLILASSAGTSGTFTVGMLVAFVAYKAQFTSRMTRLIDHLADFSMLGLHAERLADIALEKAEPSEGEQIDGSPFLPILELRGVSFRYSDAAPWVLEDVNLKVEEGESVAITGTSGSGKTTLLKVLLGLLSPTCGHVLYGGVPIERLGSREYRRLVGAVMQDDSLLTGTLAENISFFDPNPDWARIEICAASARIAEDIEKLPMGYRTEIGDLGNGLSGGQKQRLMLARALYKQPRVLVLDEATSHLDLANERSITAELAGMSLTRVVVAHRPATIEAADRVVHLADGRVSSDERRFQSTGGYRPKHHS